MDLMVSIPVTFVIVTTIGSLSYSSSVNNDKDKGFSYHQASDGHFCFGKERICEKPLTHDERAESPYYSEE
jgi:hypothetical protein